jgi:1,4-dihydroxy-6-naphthoate synthase
MNGDALRLGFSSCPNDTFMFHALVTGDALVPGVRWDVVMEDIEALNARAIGPEPLPVTKVSVGVLPYLVDRYAVLGAGAALGRGCGPLVVARPGGPTSLADLAGRRIAIPGAKTTANLLLAMFGPPDVQRVEMRFDEIMPAVARGDVEAGLVIHESRFTYPDHGLVQLEDLGVRWEAATGGPLPLGVIVASRELSDARTAAIEAGLRASIERAFADPQRSRDYVRAHAQEMSEDVCRRHIELYVNAYSIDLGDEGRAAIDELVSRARAAGAPAGRSPWR